MIFARSTYFIAILKRNVASTGWPKE